MAWAKNGTPLTLGSELDDMDITDLTACKLNLFIGHILRTGNVNPDVILDNTTGNDYATRYSYNGGTDATQTSQPEHDISSGGMGQNFFYVCYGVNIDSEEKLFIGFDMRTSENGATSAPNRKEHVWKKDTSTDTGQFTRLDIHNSNSGGFTSGSNISALGSDLTPASATSIETGSIYIDTDTASRYWFNGTTWYRAVDDTGLKAYWKFNASSSPVPNDSQSADSLGTAADIAVTGATHGATGQIGDALSYDGLNDYGTAGTSLSQYQFMYSADAQYTLCMWFKLLSKIDSQGISSLFGNFGTANANGVVLQLSDGTTTDKVKLFILGESTNTRYIDSSIDDFMDDDTNWHFLCVRFDGTAAGHAAGNNYEVSIDNGAFQTLSTSSAPSGTANSDESFKFGVYPATGIGRYLGFLQDETSLWSRKLTDDEVSELYNGGSGREIY